MALKLKGTASWAKVFEPDTKFNPEGVYSINVSIPEADAAHVCEQLDTLMAEYTTKLVKEKPQLKASLSMRPPYEAEYDENGNETGNLLFKSKMKASGTTKEGRTWQRKPVVVDTKLTPLNKSTLIGNGSTVIVAVDPSPYYMPSNKQAGVSLRMVGVQVTNLVEYQGANSIFDEEDGFVAQAVAKDDSSDVFSDTDTDAVADAEGDF
jgi:hypothetical protein